MTFLSFTLLLLPVGAFVIFWKYSVKRKQNNLERLSISISLCLWAMIAIFWISTSQMNSGDGGRFGFASSLAILVRWIIKSLPITAPEIVELLGLEEKPIRKHQPLLASFLVSIYIVFGYLCVAVFFNSDPRAFLLNIENQWWVVLVALLSQQFGTFIQIGKKQRPGT